MFRIPAAFWTLLSTVLASFGVAYVPSDAVKSVIAAAAGLVLAVYQWQHHKTRRHEQTTAAELAGRKLDARHQADENETKRLELEAHRDVQDHAVGLATAATQALSQLAMRVRALEEAHTPALDSGHMYPDPPAFPKLDLTMPTSANSGNVAP